MEIEAQECVEAEALRTELPGMPSQPFRIRSQHLRLQVKVSSGATFEDDPTSFIQDRAAVVVDDVADFPTMFVTASLKQLPSI